MEPRSAPIIVFRALKWSHPQPFHEIVAHPSFSSLSLSLQAGTADTLIVVAAIVALLWGLIQFYVISSIPLKSNGGERMKMRAA